MLVSDLAGGAFFVAVGLWVFLRLRFSMADFNGEILRRFDRERFLTLLGVLSALMVIMGVMAVISALYSFIVSSR